MNKTRRWAIIIIIIYSFSITGCAYLQPRYKTPGDWQIGTPPISGSFTQNKAYEWHKMANDLMQEQMAINKLNQSASHSDPVKGYMGVIINEDTSENLNFSLVGPETVSYDVGSRRILVVYLLPGLYNWKVSNGYYIEGTGAMTVGLKTHFVDEQSYLQQRFKKINEEGEEINNLQTQYHFRITKRR